MPVTDDNHKDKANLIATLGSGEGGLVLSGHADTVPCNELAWQSNPFTLTEKDGRLYGLGATDMKGFLAMAVEAALPFINKPLKAPLIILATADEESSMSGARALVAADMPKAKFAIIGEPTSLVPIRAHKGIIMESVRVIGKAGHSSDPALGLNAMEGMHKVVHTLLNWRNELQKQYKDASFAVPYPTLNLGHIHGGDNPNRICYETELHFDLRPIPGMALDELREKLNQILKSSLQNTDYQIELRSLIHGTEPMDTKQDSEIVKIVEELSEHKATTAAYCTEGPYLNSLGMQSIVMGPGHIAQAHQANEFLPMEHIEPTISFLRNMIQRCCC